MKDLMANYRKYLDAFNESFKGENTVSPQEISDEIIKMNDEFKKDYAMIPKIGIAKNELFMGYYEKDNLQVFQIWLQDIKKSVSPSYLQGRAFRNGAINLCHKVEDGEDKYFAFLDDGKTFISTGQGKCLFDPGDDLIKLYMDLGMKHKTFLKIYTKYKYQKPVCSNKEFAMYMKLLGNPFTKIRRCKFSFGGEVEGQEFWIKTIHAVDPNPRLVIKAIPKSDAKDAKKKALAILCDDEITDVVIGTRLTSEAEIKKVVNDAFSKAQVEFDFSLR